MADTKINGVEYRVYELTGLEAYKLLTRLTLIAGAGSQYLPLIARSAIEEAADESAQGLVTNATTLAASAAMIKEAGVDEIISFKRDVIEIAEVKQPSGEYRVVNLAADFRGDLKGAEELFNYVIKVQLADFTQGSEGNGLVDLAILLIRVISLNEK